MRIETANQLNGIATSVCFLSGFGALWLLLALLASEHLHAAEVAGVLVGMAVFIVMVFKLFRAAKRWPRVPDDPAVGRRFGWINAIQWIAIFLVFQICAHWHIQDYSLAAVTAIVGLHFFPLASLFRNPTHHATGAMLVVWSVAAVLILPRQSLFSITALGTGLLLWQAAAMALSVGLSAVSEGPVLQPIQLR